MEYIIGIGALILIFWLFSSKKQSDATVAFASADLAKGWFLDNDLDFKKANFSAFREAGATTLIGVTYDKSNTPKGFAVTVDHQYSTRPDGVVITPADAMNAKMLVAQAKKSGVPVVEYLRYSVSQ